MIKRDTREKARQLRRQGWSVSEIKEELGVSRSSVSLWVRDIQLTEAQKDRLHEKQRRWKNQNSGAQTNRRNAKKLRQTYQNAGREQANQGDSLHLMGCMLYWAEGAKNRNGIHFVNSDPNMMQLFIRFLKDSLHVESSIINLQVHCHTPDEVEHERIKRYWAELLDQPLACFNKVQVKKGSDTRRNRLENGVCAIRIHRTELAQHIFGAIQEYGDFENPEWLL